MTKIIKEFTKNYTVIPNNLCQDKLLSWKSKGIFLYLWSLPDDWDYYQTEIATHATDGIDSLRKGLQELEKLGYLRIKRNRDENGKFRDSDWVITSEPKLDNPVLVNPIQENETLLSTNITKDLLNKEEEEPLYNFVTTWEKCGFGMISPMMIEKLNYWVNDFNGKEEIICYAIEIAEENDGKHYAYVNAILKSWEDKKVKSLEDAKSIIQKRKNKTKKPKIVNNSDVEEIWG